jgi:hypothetical protein
VADPVSWLLISTGWDVVAADGSKAAEVDEVLGDRTADIFDGLAVSTSALGKPRYLPAEAVTAITEGRVSVSLARDEIAALDEYLMPATSLEVEPSSHGGTSESIRAEARKLEGEALAPVHSHERPVGIWRRIVLYFRRQER